MKFSDTDPTILAAQEAIWQRMSGGERPVLAREMSERARQFSLARLRAEHPSWSHRELMLELLRMAMDPEPLPPGTPMASGDPFKDILTFVELGLPCTKSS